MKKKLKSLKQHNREKYELQLKSHLPYKNGIACPKCGEELFDSTPNLVLNSNPPQYNIHCEKCGFKGYRF